MPRSRPVPIHALAGVLDQLHALAGVLDQLHALAGVLDQLHALAEGFRSQLGIGFNPPRRPGRGGSGAARLATLQTNLIKAAHVSTTPGRQSQEGSPVLLVCTADFAYQLHALAGVLDQLHALAGVLDQLHALAGVLDQLHALAGVLDRPQ